MSEEKKREKILDVRDLDITFETTAGKVHAIRGVNIDLYQGETVAIVGESGTGKSVTMRAAMGILAKNAVVNKGEIIYRYRDNIGGIDYNPEGVFELDGTLTDTSDICNQIDLGVTKCYGLLNLTIKNTRLAKQADLSHIYLIGGQYILDRSTNLHPSRESSYYIGRNLNNFHTSMDITIGYSNSSFYWYAMAKEATASSISGRVICTIASNAPVYPLAYTCNDCVAYTRFDMQVPSTSAYGMGYTANHSICRVSYAATQPVFTGYSRSATIYGLGVTVTNSLADSTYDCRNQNGIAVFGQQCTNCTFSGQYYGNETYSNLSQMRLCSNATNMAITETAVFNGITTALVYGSDNDGFSCARLSGQNIEAIRKGDLFLLDQSQILNM